MRPFKKLPRPKGFKFLPIHKTTLHQDAPSLRKHQRKDSFQPMAGHKGPHVETLQRMVINHEHEIPYTHE